VSVTDWSSYQNLPTNKRAILNDASVEQFAQSMNEIKFNFTYDFSMAIMKYDIRIKYYIL
jgi:hypothetical protein